MVQDISKELFERLAKAGLPERVSEEELALAVAGAGHLIALVRDKKYERILGIGDDFIPDTGLYNALGTVYSLLPCNIRDEALAAYLTQFDHLNDFYVQNNHTPFVREPSVLADIGMVRPRYWPGLDEGKVLTREHKNFDDFKRELLTEDGLFNPEKVRSDFCVAYAALRTDMSSFGSDYAAACHLQFLERVVGGIAALRFGRVNDDSGIKDGHKRLRDLLPKNVHGLIDRKYEERSWADPAGFPYK